MKYLIILVFYLESLNVTSQNDSLPTSFFNEYSKFSVHLGVSKYVGSETSELPSTLEYRLKEFISPVLGIDYDIFQKNNFNFKLGLNLTLMRDIEWIYLSQSETGYAFDYISFSETSTDGQWRLSLPITTEYILNSGKNKISFNSSLIIGYHKSDGLGYSEFGTVTEDDRIVQLESTYGQKTAPWYFNGQVGVGMYFPFKGWMLRTNVYYNLAFQKLYEGEFEFKNLQQSPDTSGKLSFKGNSFGIEFSIYLAKKKKKQ